MSNNRDEAVTNRDDPCTVATAAIVKKLAAVPDAEWERIRKQAQALDAEIDAIRKDPKNITRGKLCSNWIAHSALLKSGLADAFDPVTGADWRSLRWPSGLNLQEAQLKASEIYQKALDAEAADQ